MFLSIWGGGGDSYDSYDNDNDEYDDSSDADDYDDDDDAHYRDDDDDNLNQVCLFEAPCFHSLPDWHEASQSRAPGLHISLILLYFSAIWVIQI